LTSAVFRPKCRAGEATLNNSLTSPYFSPRRLPFHKKEGKGKKCVIVSALSSSMQIIQATFAIPKEDITNLDKGTSPFHNRTSECSTGCAGRAELRQGGSLAQVTVHRQILKENEIEMYEKNTKSTIWT
jgi:hypothetical protein